MALPRLSANLERAFGDADVSFTYAAPGDREALGLCEPRSCQPFRGCLGEWTARGNVSHPGDSNDPAANERSEWGQLRD